MRVLQGVAAADGKRRWLDDRSGSGRRQSGDQRWRSRADDGRGGGPNRKKVLPTVGVGRVRVPRGVPAAQGVQGPGTIEKKAAAVENGPATASRTATPAHRRPVAVGRPVL